MIRQGPRTAQAATARGLFPAAALLCAASFALRYPGEISFDAAKQLAQAASGRYEDWHPPIMAAWWSVLRRVAPAGPAMLAFQMLVHWFGVALVADGLVRSGRRRAAWVMLASGASPLFLYYQGIIYKDVALASTLLAAFGIAFWFRVQDRRLPIWAAAAALVLLAYGTLVRTNAVFAFGPMLLFLFERSRWRTGRMLAASLALAAVAIPVSAFINRDLFKAGDSGVRQTLELFDLAGIAHQSGDGAVLPDAARMSAADLAQCYAPLYWDTLRMDVCHRAFDRLPPPGTPEREAIGRRWVAAIVHHPLAYAEHRLKAFNALLNFFVPAQQCRFAPFDASCGTPDPRTGRMLTTSDSAAFIRRDYVKKPFPVWPVTWLALGLCLAALLWSRPAATTARMSRPLLASGLLYALAYVVVGVAGDIRYFYWPIVAFQTALIVGWDGIESRLRRPDVATWACGGVLLSVIAAGYVARLTDNASLLAP